MEFYTDLPVVMMIGATVGYRLGYSINMLLELELGNSFGTMEGSLIRVSLNTALLLTLDNDLWLEYY